MNYSGMRKITKIDDYIIIKLSYHDEWFVYLEGHKEQGVFYKTYKEAIQSVLDKINY